MRKIQRRAVYVGTIVAMVAMAGGFAVATIPNAFTFNGGGQNGGAVTTGNTQYAGAVQINLADVNPGSCVASGSVQTVTATASPGTFSTFYIDPAAPACPGVNTYWEVFNFTTSSSVIGSDIITVYVTGGGAAGTYSLVVDQTVGGEVQLVGMAIDFGPDTGAPDMATNIAVVVTGA